MNMSEQRVLVTGGTRGIGLELARALSRRGARVAVLARSEMDLRTLGSLGSGAMSFEADLTSTEEIARVVKMVRDEFGPPTILVNNAGVQFNHDWVETRAEDRRDWARTELAVNLFAPIELTALLLDDLAAAPEAAIVNVTSILAVAPKSSAPVYCASKAALSSFTNGLRYQLETRPNVRVVEVVPPVVDTAMTAGRDDDKMDPADVAEAVARRLEDGSDEIRVGKARIVHLMHRIAPGLVRRILKHG